MSNPASDSSESSSPTPPTPQQPGARPPLVQAQAILGELMWLALTFLGGVLTITILMLVGALPDVEEAAWSGILAGPILIGSAAAFYMLVDQRSPSAPLLAPEDRRGTLVCLAIAVTGIAVALVGSSLLGWAQESLLSTEVEEQQVIVALVERGDPFEIAILALSAVVFAPITEELLFRHMFFRRLTQRTGMVLAFALPAIAFSLSHWNPVGLLIYIWLGLVFAFAYLSSGRLWVAILVHAGHNATALSILLWAPDLGA